MVRTESRDDSWRTQRPRIHGRGDGSFQGSARGHTCGLHDRLDFMVQRLPTKVRTRKFEPHRSVAFSATAGPGENLMLLETVSARRRAIGSTVSMVSFDVDGTLFRRAALHQAAGALGIREEWDAIDERFDLGRITLRERLESHYRLLQGIRLDHILREVFKVEVIKNVREAVEKLREHGIRVVLLTDLPDFLCVDLAERFGFDGHIASKVGIRTGIVAGNIEPLADKSLGLQAYCSERSIPLSECIHVGDGVNDVPVFQIVRYSIALNAQNEQVEASASHRMQTGDLLDVYRHLQPFL